VIISFLIPGTENLSQIGIRTIGIVIAFLLLLITEALPLTIICWTVLGLMPLLGLTPGFAAALTGFSNPVLFFILASFGLAAAFLATPLSKRILVFLLKRFGKNMKSMLFAFMLCILPVTAFTSSVPTVAVFMALGLSFLELYDNEKAKRATGRTLMIAIPVACQIGSVSTPVGSTINLLAIGLLEQHTGQTISFVQWMAVGIPITLLILPVAWLLIYHIYKPAEITQEMVNTYINKLDVPKEMTVQEKKVLILIGVMLVLWILSSWVRQINVMVVALLGTCIMFLPGVRILEWKSFIKNVNFEAFFLVGTVLSLGMVLGLNGGTAWIISMFPTGYMSLPILVAFTVTLVFAVLIIIPVGPSVVMFLAVPLIVLAQSMGINPALVILVLAMAACQCYLLPLDTIPLITYGSGYYSMLDMPKSTLPLQVYIIFVITMVVSLASMVFNII